LNAAQDVYAIENTGGMMRKTKPVYLMFLFIILVCSFSIAASAADMKIGMVDFQQIVEKSEPGKRIESGLKQEGERMEGELSKDKEELKSLKEKIEREAMVMSREAREEKEIEFRVKARNLQEKEKRYRAEFVGKQREEVNKLRQVVLEIVQDIGKKEGYTLVLSKVGVLYHDNAVDLTDKVVTLLNKRLAGKDNQ
jgi:outer membrane protein